MSSSIKHFWFDYVVNVEDKDADDDEVEVEVDDWTEEDDFEEMMN